MDYEKKYKDALERARNIRFGNPSSATANVVCEEIFPELKKSEDEKIRIFINNSLCFIPDVVWENNNVTKEELIAWIEKQGEQKPAKRSDKEFDDFFNLESVIDIVEMYGKGEVRLYGDDVTSELEWLKSLRDRLQPQPKQEWGKEDDEMLNGCLIDLRFLIDNGRKRNKELYQNEIKWLKGIKDRVQPQQNQEWGEEDEKMLNRVNQSLYRYQDHLIGSPLADDVEIEINWLKSLKPQPHWKPTEEQIQTLEETIEYDAADANVVVLRTLYNNLKKL